MYHIYLLHYIIDVSLIKVKSAYINEFHFYKKCDVITDK